MPDLKITRDWKPGVTSDETEIDNFETALEDFFNVTKLNADNIQSSSITTANIAANAVTRAKRPSKNISSSSDVTSHSDTGASASAIGGSGATTVNISTVGRPVIIALMSTGDTGSFEGTLQVQTPSGGSTATATIVLRRNSSDIARWNFTLTSAAFTGRSQLMNNAPGGIWLLDTPIAGSQSYEFFSEVSVGTFNALEIKAIAYEL